MSSKARPDDSRSRGATTALRSISDAPTPHEFRGPPRHSGPSGPTQGTSSSRISDVQNYADPENNPLISHTPSFGGPSLAGLVRQLSDADAQSRPGSQKRAPADDLSPSDPAR